MRSLLWRGLAVAIVLVAVAAGGWHFYGGSAKKRFEARVEALRAAGHPTRLEDLATPAIPDEENAAKLLEQARSILKEIEREHDRSLLWKDEPNDEELRSIAAFVESLAPYFSLLDQVPQRPGFRLDIDWSQRAPFLNPHIPAYQEIAELLTARAEFDRDWNGRTERSAATAVLLMDIGERGAGPFAIGRLVSWTVTSGAITVLRNALKGPGFDAAAFRATVDPRLAKAIPDRGPPVSMLIEERVFLLDVLEAIDAGDVSSHAIGQVEDRWLPFLYRPGLYKEAMACLDLAGEAIGLADTTPEHALSVSAEFRSRYGRSTDRDDFDQSLGVLYTGLFAKYAQHVASLRLARVVMALVEHRQANGAWSESLADLGDMPTDPYSGKPFLYERTEHGCRVRVAREDWTDEQLESSNLLWTLEDAQIPAMPR